MFSPEDTRKRVLRLDWGAILFSALVSLNPNDQSHFTHGTERGAVARCPATERRRLTAIRPFATQRAAERGDRRVVWSLCLCWLGVSVDRGACNRALVGILLWRGHGDHKLLRHGEITVEAGSTKIAGPVHRVHRPVLERDHVCRATTRSTQMNGPTAVARQAAKQIPQIIREGTQAMIGKLSGKKLTIPNVNVPPMPSLALTCPPEIGPDVGLESGPGKG